MFESRRIPHENPQTPTSVLSSEIGENVQHFKSKNRSRVKFFLFLCGVGLRTVGRGRRSHFLRPKRETSSLGRGTAAVRPADLGIADCGFGTADSPGRRRGNSRFVLRICPQVGDWPITYHVSPVTDLRKGKKMSRSGGLRGDDLPACEGSIAAGPPRARRQSGR